jgi:hypothetical protein
MYVKICADLLNVSLMSRSEKLAKKAAATEAAK